MPLAGKFYSLGTRERLVSSRSYGPKADVVVNGVRPPRQRLWQIVGNEGGSPPFLCIALLFGLVRWRYLPMRCSPGPGRRMRELVG